MRSVFHDTVGILALLDADDQWHHQAVEAFQRITDARIKTLTTEIVLLECGNAAARRPYRGEMRLLREQHRAQDLLVTVAAGDLEAAWTAYDRGDAARAGIVDQVSFVVMRRLGMIEAFTNDQHFRAAGFVTLF